MRIQLWIAAALAGMSGSSTHSQQLPPLAPEMVGSAAVVCIRIDDSGAVSGAFIVTTSGDSAKDRAIIVWVRQLRWKPATPTEQGRNLWFPMPIAFGNVPPPPPPESCAPPADAQVS